MKKALRVFCMILIIASFFTVTAFASYSIDPVEPGQITIDGEVTEAEWGEAQEYYYISKGYESDTDEFVTWEYMPGYQSEATFEAYFKYDADYLYYAMTCHGIVPGNKLTTDQLKEHWNTDYWKQCCSWIGIAMYDDVVNNPQTKLFPSGEETRQVWTKLYFSLLDDGTQYACEDIVKGIWCTEYDGSNYTVLTEDDYAITYNGADLTYEARIPWSMITDRDDVGAGDNIVTAVVCKMDLQDGCESGNTLQWGAGVCTDNMTTGGVLGRLVGDKTEAAEPAKTEAAEEPAEEAAAEEPAEEPAEEATEEPAEEPAEEAAEKEAPAKTSSKRTILYVVLGVLVAAIIVIVILLFSGDKKKENKKEEEKEEKKD